MFWGVSLIYKKTNTMNPMLPWWVGRRLLVPALFFITPLFHVLPQNCNRLFENFENGMPAGWIAKSGAAGLAAQAYFHDGHGYSLLTGDDLVTPALKKPSSIRFWYAITTSAVNKDLQLSYSLGSQGGPYTVLTTFRLAAATTLLAEQYYELPEQIRNSEQVYLRLYAPSARSHHLDDIEVLYNCTLTDANTPVLVFGKESISKYLTEPGFYNPLSISLNGEPAELPVQYASDDPLVAEVNATGRVTLRGVGNTRIRATVLPTENTGKAETSFLLTVREVMTGVLAKDGFNGSCELPNPANQPAGVTYPDGSETYYPALIPFEGSHALCVGGRETQYTTAYIDTRAYKDISCTFRLGAYGKTPLEGMDQDDYVKVSVCYPSSSGSGVTYVQQAQIKGFSNKQWPLSTTQVCSVTASKTASKVETVGPVGMVKINGISPSEKTSIRITLYSSGSGECWVLDDFILRGTLRELTPELISPKVLEGQTQLTLTGNWSREAVKLFNQSLGDTKNRLDNVTLAGAVFQPDAGVEQLLDGCGMLTSVTVDEATTGVTGRFTGVNPNCLVYLPESSAPGTLGNVIYGNRAVRVTLTDGAPFHCPKAFMADEIRYTREFSEQKQSGYNGEVAGWETLTLPFAVEYYTALDKAGAELRPFGNSAFDPAAGYKPFWLRRLGGEGFLNVEQHEAHQPYIICMPNNPVYHEKWNIWGKVLFSATDVRVGCSDEAQTVAGATFDMKCALRGTNRDQTVYAINDAGSGFEADLRDIRPFEGYAVMKEGMLNAPLRLPFPGAGGVMTELVAIFPLQATPDCRVYEEGGMLIVWAAVPGVAVLRTIDGQMVRRVNLQTGVNQITGLQRGIYLLDRRKVVLTGR